MGINSVWNATRTSNALLLLKFIYLKNNKRFAETGHKLGSIFCHSSVRRSICKFEKTDSVMDTTPSFINGV